MTQDERDQLVTELLKTLQNFSDLDPAEASVKYFRSIEAFISKVFENGRLEGFAAGYKEAKKNIEEHYGKLN